jgi:hypothetical protein
MKDRQTPSKSSPLLLYSTHLKALDSWYAELPIYLCLRAPTSGRIGTVDPESNERQMTAIVCLNSRFTTDRMHADKIYSSIFTLYSWESSASYCNPLWAKLCTPSQYRAKKIQDYMQIGGTKPSTFVGLIRYLSKITDTEILRSIESAIRMINLCKEMTVSNYKLSSSWIAQ